MVKWEKLQLLPIELEACHLTDPALPLMWEDTIKYLGIAISPTPSDYFELNLVPLLGYMKTKLWAAQWCNG